MIDSLAVVQDERKVKERKIAAALSPRVFSTHRSSFLVCYGNGSMGPWPWIFVS